MYPLALQPDDIDIRDIAYALAAEYRFGGHCKPRVSVAEHSVAVSRAVPAEHALWGLLHDASEAYLRDIPRPVKLALLGYAAVEARAMWAIGTRFGMPLIMPDEVCLADTLALGTEARACMPGCEEWGDLPDPLPGYVVEGWSPAFAEACFLQRFQKLTGVKL